MRPLRRLRRCLPGCALLVAAACGPDRAARPNLLLVSVDTLRADRLGVYGNDAWGVSPSPVADALAAAGVRFARADATRGQTHPSLASMLTGLYPITTGLRENGLLLRRRHRTLLQYLKDAGYRTGAFVANFDSRHTGDNWVFRGAESAADGFAGRRKQEARQESRFQRQWDDRVEAAASSFLEADDDRPFALWVHFYDVHKPYNPPPGFGRRYGLADGLPELLADPGPDSGPALEAYLKQITLGQRELPQAELRRILGLYDGTVSATDERLGRLLEQLDEAGARDSTYVVFTSDHGEELFDRQRYFFHGASVYTGVTRIPLVFAGPGLPAGAVVDAPVQNVDIAPTLLDLLGLPPATNMEGRSLAGLLRGTSREPPRPYSFTEWQDLIYVVRDAGHMYLHNPRHVHPRKPPYFGGPAGFPVGCFEGYDLAADPGEQQDLLEGLDAQGLMDRSALPEAFVPLRRALEGFLADPRHEREMSWPGLSPERAEHMRELGYVGADQTRPDVLLAEPCAPQ